MSRGAKQVLYIAPEVTKNVAPTPLAVQTLRHLNTDLGRQVMLEESDEISTLRLSQGSIAVGVDVAGTISAELSYGTFDELIAGAFGGNWATDTLTTGDLEKTFTIVRGFTDVSEWAVMSGCHINEMNLSLNNRAKADISFSIMGMSYERKTTDPTGTKAAATTTPFMSSLDVGDILVDGTSLIGKACVRSFSFNINNNAQADDCLGDGNLGPSTVNMLGQDITGELVLAWSKDASDIVEKSVSRAPIALVLPLEDAKGNKYTFTIPMAEVDGQLPSGGKNDTLNATVTYAVVKQAVTLTRLTATP